MHIVGYLDYYTVRNESNFDILYTIDSNLGHFTLKSRKTDDKKNKSYAKRQNQLHFKSLN